MNLLDKFGHYLARFLSQENEVGQHISTCTPEDLEAALEVGDILLVDGNTRFSTVIKYLTQSAWSHAALYIGKDSEDADGKGKEPLLIEVDIIEGVRKVPLSMYFNIHTRICRPVGLSGEEISRVIAFMKERIGHKYDLKNIIDLIRYLFPVPPVPQKYQRRMLAIGSGDPTRAICSSLIAQAFQSINYPILPYIEVDESSNRARIESQKELLHIRHHSLFTPRDFDVSPYFQIIKPSLQKDFDYRELNWAEKK